jgi:anti-sigma regulatory factor (Ser/Thr protein kinase)
MAEVSQTATPGLLVVSIALTPEHASVTTARRFVASRLAERDEASLAVLLTSELVANVVLHARTELTVVVEVEPCVRVEVHDGMAATEAFREVIANPPTYVSPEQPGGRGLGIVRTLTSRFGLADEPGEWHGKVVWFELDHPDLTAP